MSLGSAPPSAAHPWTAVDLLARSPCAVLTAPPAVPFRCPTATYAVGAAVLWNRLVSPGRVGGATPLRRGSLFHRDLDTSPESCLRRLDPAPVHGPWRVHSRVRATVPPVQVHGPWVPIAHGSQNPTISPLLLPVRVMGLEVGLTVGLLRGSDLHRCIP
jgi:hypothetical protein